MLTRQLLFGLPPAFLWLALVNLATKRAATQISINPKSLKPTVYLIRHGEKPVSGDHLSPRGLKRAQCLRQVFGSTSSYQLGLIVAQKPQPDGKQQRPLDTVEPLAQDLGLFVNTECSREDAKCVRALVRNHQGPGNVLVCWEHKALTEIVHELGAGSRAPEYPNDRYDLIWTDPYDYGAIAAETSESCPGLDPSSHGNDFEILDATF